MPDPTLFHGIAVMIDDQVNDENTTVKAIREEIEAAGCHVVPLTDVPLTTSIPNFREVAFFVLDWKLYGKKLEEIGGIEALSIGAGLEEQNEASIIEFLRELKKVRVAPVFIFTDESVDTVKEKLRHHKDIFDELDPSHIMVMDKKKVTASGVFKVLSDWMKLAPSVFVLKTWEKAYAKAKNEMFRDFYTKSPQWPVVLWENFKADSVPPAPLLGEIISRNLSSRMSPFDCGLEQHFASQLPAIGTEAHKNVVKQVLEGERFLAEIRLDKQSFAPGDIIKTGNNYFINIRPDCDCVPRGGDTLGRLDLYLLKGVERSLDDVTFDFRNGLISEQDNEAIVFPVFGGRALSFKFRKILSKKWNEVKDDRIGRLLPPYLTRLQQRYSAYLQRPGLPRLPSEFFPAPPESSARPVDNAYEAAANASSSAPPSEPVDPQM
jgi:hypothetical protein